MWALFASLLGLALFFLIRPAVGGDPYYRPRPSGTTYAYWHLVALAFVPYGLALWSRRRRGRRGGPSAGVLIASAAIVYAAFVPAPAQQSQDVYQYLVYGRMAIHGANPYVVAPNEATGPWTPWLQWSLYDDTPTVYGPAWTLLTAGVVRGATEDLLGSFLTLKAITAMMALGAAGLLARAVSRGGPGLRRDPGFVVLAFAWNPLVVVSVGLGAHADAAVALLLAAAVVAERNRQDPVVTLLLAVATAVKPYAGVALLAWLFAVARRGSARSLVPNTLLAGLVAAALYAPYWAGVRTLTAFAEGAWSVSASLTGTMIRLLSGHVDDAVAAGATGAAVALRVVAGLVMVAAIVAAARWPRIRAEPWRAAALLFAAYVLLTPWYLYWHLIGLIALASLVTDDRLTRGVGLFGATSVLTFTGGPAIGLLAQTIVRYGPPILAAGLPGWVRDRALGERGR